MEKVQKYTKPARVFHWIHTASVLVLIITGIFLFMPASGFLAQDSWSRLVHRIAVVIFVFAPLIQLMANPKTAGASIKAA